MALGWTSLPALTNGSWWGVLFADSLFWAWEEVWSSSHAGPVIESNDGGASWSAPAFIDTSFRPYAMAWNGSNILSLVGAGISGGFGQRCYARIAGVWANGTMPLAALWHSVAWNGTTFCAVRNNGAATSTNGTGWTARALTIGTLPIIVAHGTTFLAVSSSDNICRRSVTNGVSWTNATMPSSGWRGLCSNGTTVVAIGFDKIAYSTNAGLNWTEVALTHSWRSIAWDGTQFCAVADDDSFYATSADGITWVTDTLPPAIYGYAPYMTYDGTSFYFLMWDKMLKSGPPVVAGVSPFFHFTFPVTG